jgi:adenylyltransferase/sulfurtransferase
MTNDLSESEKIRYQKHLLLPEVGEAGQLRLKNSSVLLVGVGGLGSPAALYLAAAGVGHIGLLDGDKVELSNLQRQVLHAVAAIGQQKVASGEHALHALNPEIRITQYPFRLSDENAAELIGSYDVILDCTDNLATRLVINRFCVQLHRPMVHGAVYRFEGQAAVFDADRGPCYQCLFPQLPDEKVIPDPAKNGLLATTPGIIGTIMAAETLKLLLGIGSSLAGRLLVLDSLSMHFQELRLVRNKKCPVCAK